MMILIFGAFLIWKVPASRKRFLSIFTHSQGSDESSKSIRWQLWEICLQTVKSHPLAGVGTARIRILLPDEDDPKKLTLWTESHNIFLQEATEHGLVGLALFLWLLFKCGQLFWYVDRDGKAGFLAFYAGILVCGLTESWFNDAEPTMVFLSLAAFAWQLKQTKTPLLSSPRDMCYF